ncbi:hypothetical protein Tco_0631186 [Tanacetum coccineum]
MAFQEVTPANEFKEFTHANEAPRMHKEDDLRGDDLKHYEAKIEAMNLILISIPNDIYNSVNACTTAKAMWERVERLMRGTVQNQVDRETRFNNEFDQFVAKLGEALVSGDTVQNNFDDPLTAAMILLVRAITRNFSTPTNNHLCTSSNTINQAIVYGDRETSSNGVDIEDLTIEQYLELTHENHAPSVGIKVDDMTIAEYLEYEETIKTQDYDDYQPHSAKADVPIRYRDHLSPRHKSPDPPLDAKTNPYFQASLSPIHPKITKTLTKHTRENKVIKEREQSGHGVDDWFEAELENC